MMTDSKHLRLSLGAPNNHFLLPEHFLEVTLSKLGGRIETNNSSKPTVRFVFPTPQGDIARCHDPDKDFYLQIKDVAMYSFTYTASSKRIESSNFEIGHPNENEARMIRQMQKQIWGTSENHLYPWDIHSDQFALPSSLVARYQSSIAGFVFGFWRKNNQGWQIESQLAGVLPEYRKLNIAFYLKIGQALDALENGVTTISWTVDPLQIANGILNLNKLGAKAQKFWPGLYPFRNQLNQVEASRWEIEWNLDDERIRSVLTQYKPLLKEIPSINDFADCEIITGDNFSKNHLHLAINVPENWTEMQTDLSLATKIRKHTDSIFASVIRSYEIIAVAKEGRSWYLIGRKR